MDRMNMKDDPITAKVRIITGVVQSSIAVFYKRNAPFQDF